MGGRGVSIKQIEYVKNIFILFSIVVLSVSGLNAAYFASGFDWDRKPFSDTDMKQCGKENIYEVTHSGRYRVQMQWCSIELNGRRLYIDDRSHAPMYIDLKKGDYIGKAKIHHKYPFGCVSLYLVD
jgi:hypothetical protein